MSEPLRAIGYWRCPENFVFLPHPKELVDRERDIEDRWVIAEYLRSGVRLHSCLGFSHCCFRNGPPDEEMGSADLTDGIWVWPEGLPVYVERYAVRLPKDFCLHARRQQQVSVTPEQLEALQMTPYSFEEWIYWCCSNRSNRWLAALSLPALPVIKWLAKRIKEREMREEEREYVVE
ncbi:hypothetical protein [Zavarzinella formosa]|uniref:hypothetical protein n=1 Tax=Zavarzinella formosa TaxID=360055 RepID=UPI00037E520E|nr:hypothetical protein [Zavarzinella formosa]